MPADLVGLVLVDLDAGRRTLVVCPGTIAELRATFDQVLAAAQASDRFGDALRWRISAGNESIELPAGGWVKFRSRRQSVRGMTADVVLIPRDAGDQLLAEAQPCVMASRGEVLRW